MTTVATLHTSAGDEHWSLAATETFIGRTDECDIALAHSSISRRHCAVTRSTHGWTLRDLDSSNGTWINGERIEEPYPLRDGDEIVLAGVITLRFVDPQATPAAPAIGRLSGVWIDPETAAVWVDAQPVEPPLSQRQQSLIELLDKRHGEVVSREDIIDHVWADVAAEGVSAEAVDALVKRLRARIRPLQLHGEWLEVIRGRGMRLLTPDDL